MTLSNFNFLNFKFSVHAKKNKKNKEVNHAVNFGEYQGTYEGDIAEISRFALGNVKQRSGAASQLTPETRRYSHLKLMISYVMGSGRDSQIALKLLNYKRGQVLNNLSTRKSNLD